MMFLLLNIVVIISSDVSKKLSSLTFLTIGTYLESRGSVSASTILNDLGNKFAT